MKHSEITIAGKSVIVGYCYATEIVFKDFAGEDIALFFQEVLEAYNAQPARMPDVKKSIYLILAAATSWYASRKEDAPVKDTDLMNDATPHELGTAIGTIVGLYSQFYAIPAGETQEEKGPQGKN